MEIRSTTGARPINFNRDIGQILALLEAAFGREVTGEAPKYMQYTPAFLHRFDPIASRMGNGVVWEENGRIVGNANILKSEANGRYLVVNVAVHPDWRRRGIARQLMDEVARIIRQEGGREIWLQVDATNRAALDLYQQMKFETLGSVTTWEASIMRIRDIHPTLNGERKPQIRPLRGSEWQQALQLDRLSVSPDLDWPEPIHGNLYRLGLVSRFFNFINGRFNEAWVISTQSGKLVGLAGIWNEWGRPCRARLRVHPDWKGRLERPLCAKLMAQLSRLSTSKAQIEHPADDEETAALLKAANFISRRTLIHMRLTIDD